MSLDINIASLVSFIFVMMIGMIAYFLQGIMKRLEGIEGKSMQSSLKIAQIEKELEAIIAEQSQIREKTKTYDTNIETFWKELPEIILKAVQPQFDLLRRDIERLHDDIEYQKKQ